MKYEDDITLQKIKDRSISPRHHWATLNPAALSVTASKLFAGAYREAVLRAVNEGGKAVALFAKEGMVGIVVPVDMVYYLERRLNFREKEQAIQLLYGDYKKNFSDYVSSIGEGKNLVIFDKHEEPWFGVVSRDFSSYLETDSEGRVRFSSLTFERDHPSP